MQCLCSFDLSLVVLEIETQASSIQSRCSVPKPHHLVFHHAFVIPFALVCLQTSPSLEQVIDSLIALRLSCILKFSLVIFISFKLR